LRIFLCRARQDAVRRTRGEDCNMQFTQAGIVVQKVKCQIRLYPKGEGWIGRQGRSLVADEIMAEVEVKGGGRAMARPKSEYGR
jgi:hypothetical protein